MELTFYCRLTDLMNGYLGAIIDTIIAQGGNIRDMRKQEGKWGSGKGITGNRKRDARKGEVRRRGIIL